MTKDPICGMTVDEKTALHAERDGKSFYFCGEGCRQKFLAVPANGKGEENKDAPMAPSMANKESSINPIYTCPMHPQIQQDHPGACPKCGMALERKNVTAATSDEEDTELRGMMIGGFMRASRHFYESFAPTTIMKIILARLMLLDRS